MGPLSLKEALSTAQASQYLVSLPFENHHPEISSILCITVCPYSSKLKEKFLKDYELFGTTDLTEYIEEDEFDVVVIGRNYSHHGAFVSIDLRSFLRENSYQMVA
jgi:hypothetical protein